MSTILSKTVGVKGEGESLFSKAAKVFSGWDDPETGARLLHIAPKKGDFAPGELHSLYHQFNGFIDGGTKVLLRTGTKAYAGGGAEKTYVMDLVTGEMTDPFPAGYSVYEVADETKLALMMRPEPENHVAVLWDMRQGREVAALPIEKGWRISGFQRLSDGSGATCTHVKGKPYLENVESRMWLIKPGQTPKLILEAQGYFCNHMQSCPTDVNLLTYDRWPSPIRDVDQVIHVMSLDGKLHEPAKLDAKAMRPGSMYGARDHYLWTPDGKRIVSYLNPDPLSTEQAYSPEFNHFKIKWVLSALDWRTGEDCSAVYPPMRWGCHMGVSLDSKYILCCGGNGFDKLFVVDIQKLKDGWNERVVCGYPRTVSQGNNVEPFPQPTMIPDGSGILFNAGWPGEKHGVYLAQWNG